MYFSKFSNVASLLILLCFISFQKLTLYTCKCLFLKSLTKNFYIFETYFKIFSSYLKTFEYIIVYFFSFSIKI